MNRPMIHPAWWPVMLATGPVWGVGLVASTLKSVSGRKRAGYMNARLLEKPSPELPELAWLSVTPVVEWKTAPGFRRESGVSYLVETDRGRVLLDVGYGNATPVFSCNAQQLALSERPVDAVVLSHLHADHMGGVKAQRKKRLTLPAEVVAGDGARCFLPEPAEVPGWEAVVVDGPRAIPAGLALTGPLHRDLGLMGMGIEQTLVARVKGVGGVMIAGCGHPGMDVMLEAADRIVGGRVSVFFGGLHLPVTDGRGNKAGIRLQQLLGTGKSPWDPITKRDLQSTMARMEEESMKAMFVSGHDSCDFTLETLGNRFGAGVLRAGEAVRIGA